MLRIHLVQMDYSPCYYDYKIDYLEEPFHRMDGQSAALGSLREFPEVEGYLIDHKSAYVDNLRRKVVQIVQWSHKRGSHMLVFPEYSIPAQILPELHQISQELALCLIAGTHRVSIGPGTNEAYSKLPIDPAILEKGAAYAPVFFPNGKTTFVKKSKKSKWEPDLKTSPAEPRKTFSLDLQGQKVVFAVLPCIDSLHPDTAGSLFCDLSDKPQLLVCPSYSPTVEPFQDAGTFLSHAELIFAYANAAAFGGTRFIMPASWGEYASGSPYGMASVPVDCEAILEMDIQPADLFEKRGSIYSAPTLRFPKAYPMVYSKNAGWLKDYNAFRDLLLQGGQDKEYLLDVVDTYLPEGAPLLPTVVATQLKALRYSILPLFDGDISVVTDTTELAIIESCDDPQTSRAGWVARALSSLTTLVNRHDVELSEHMLSCLTTLKDVQRRLPATTPSAGVAGADSPTFVPETFSGNQDLLDSYQDRGPNLTEVLEHLTNEDTRLLFIGGAFGIGKTDFCNVVFRKKLPDWDLLRIDVTEGAKVPTLITAIAYRVGISLDVDALSLATGKVFRHKIRKVLQSFFQKKKRALLVDDISLIIRDGTVRDMNQLEILIEECAQIADPVGGRLIIVSSSPLPGKWLNTAHVAHQWLDRIDDRFVRRIVEYHLRKECLVNTEKTPDIPQELVDILKGHPLSARLVLEAVRAGTMNMHDLATELESLTVHIATALLKYVSITSSQRDALQGISVFRLPMSREILEHLPETGELVPVLIELSNRCVISYDGRAFHQHEAVRRYFYQQIEGPDKAKSIHRLVALYYECISKRDPAGFRRDPILRAELAYHLAMSGQVERARDFNAVILEELKPAARQLYKERQYDDALSLYRLLSGVAPHDVDILAYVARCYCREGQWGDGDRAFTRAIETARKMNLPIWYIHRDWGQLKASPTSAPG